LSRTAPRHSKQTVTEHQLLAHFRLNIRLQPRNQPFAMFPVHCSQFGEQFIPGFFLFVATPPDSRSENCADRPDCNCGPGNDDLLITASAALKQDTQGAHFSEGPQLNGKRAAATEVTAALERCRLNYGVAVGDTVGVAVGVVVSVGDAVGEVPGDAVGDVVGATDGDGEEWCGLPTPRSQP